MLLVEEVEEYKEEMVELQLLLKCKENMLFQRATLRWLQECDVNTSYFHACVKSRKISSNMVVALKSGERWVDAISDVREEKVNYFRNHFKELTWEHVTLNGG